jgi:hypothetical protein
MNLHLFIPNLFWPDSTFHEIYQDLSLPAIETLFAKSLQTKDESEGVEDWLCKVFSVEKQQDLPVAPLTLLADKVGDVETGDGYWLRADPVHLRVEHDQVLLADSRTFRISLEEACQFTKVINKHFAEEDLSPLCGIDNRRKLISLLPLCSDRWYLYMQKTPLIQTHLLSETAAKNINDYFPYGTEEIFWKGILNEIQMLLYEHPLNQAREERGDLAINGIWFWGGGVIPKLATSPYTHVWSNDVFPRSLARAFGTNHTKLPVNLDLWRQQNKSGRHLVFLDSLYGKSKYGDAYGWRESLKELEKEWFEPILNMLKKNVINQITITTINKGVAINFSITKNNLYKFWRMGKPFSTHVN